MRYVLAGFILLGCTGELVAPVPVALPVPVLRFVGVCERPALWSVWRDGAPLPPTGMWFFLQADSLDFTPIAGVHLVEWSELAGTGVTLQVGSSVTDTEGVARIEARCTSSP
jgi:hypothetical protein